MAKVPEFKSTEESLDEFIKYLEIDHPRWCNNNIIPEKYINLLKNVFQYGNIDKILKHNYIFFELIINKII